MNDLKSRDSAAAGHARAERATKTRDLESGAITVRAIKSRAAKRSRATPRPANSIVTRPRILRLKLSGREAR